MCGGGLRTSAMLLLMTVLTSKTCPAAEPEPPVDKDGRPLIHKRGTIDLVRFAENTLVLFHGKPYSFRWAGTLEKRYFHFIDYETGKATPRFAHGYAYPQAFVEGDTVYVSAVAGIVPEEMDRVHLLTSKDLVNWESRVVLDLPGWMIFTTPICKAGDRYVMMLGVCSGPAEEIGAGFTCRFATSKDLKDWEMTPKECVYAKDRYTAGHFIRYLDGYFYNFYLEAHNGWEMRVVRSKDLIDWETSPVNPVLRASDEDRKLANPNFTEAQRQRIATATNINNSDMSFREYKGRVIIHYNWSDQQTPPSGFAEAIYEGTQAEFLRGWFPKTDPQPVITPRCD